MIDLKQAVDKLRSNEVPNPVAAQATSLSNKVVDLLSSENYNISGFASSVSSLIRSANGAAAQVVSSLHNRLPLMKAADNISAKLAIGSGSPLPPGGSDAFKAVFNPMETAINGIKTVEDTLTPEVLERLGRGDTQSLDNLQVQILNASNDLYSANLAASAAYADQIKTLKAYSLVKFASMPQPPHVQKYLNMANIPRTSPSSAYADASICSKTDPYRKTELPVVSSSAEGEILKPTPAKYVPPKEAGKTKSAKNLAGIGYTKPGAYSDFKNDYFEYTQPLVEEATKYYDEVLRPATDEAMTWRNTNIPNYADIKAKALSKPGDEAAKAEYDKVKAKFIAEGGAGALEEKLAIYNRKRDNIVRLKKQWEKWVLEEFETATAGPTW